MNSETKKALEKIYAVALAISFGGVYIKNEGELSSFSYRVEHTKSLLTISYNAIGDNFSSNSVTFMVGLTPMYMGNNGEQTIMFNPTSNPYQNNQALYEFVIGKISEEIEKGKFQTL